MAGQLLIPVLVVGAAVGAESGYVAAAVLVESDVLGLGSNNIVAIAEERQAAIERECAATILASLAAGTPAAGGESYGQGFLETFSSLLDELRQSQCWLISPREYEKLRGSSAKRRIKATLSDAECLQLFELLEEGWANVARLLRVFGLRMWEVNCLIVRTNADGEAQLFCREGKVYTTRGVKRSNYLRWLEAVPVAGQSFELVGQIQRCELKLPIGSDGNPMEISGANLGKALRRLPYWQELVKQKAEQGEWLRPYSFRDTYSLVCESMQVHKADLCEAMGHSEEVHNRSYRTTSFRTMRDSFKQAFRYDQRNEQG